MQKLKYIQSSSCQPLSLSERNNLREWLTNNCQSRENNWVFNICLLFHQAKTTKFPYASLLSFNKGIPCFEVIPIAEMYQQKQNNEEIASWLEEASAKMSNNSDCLRMTIINYPNGKNDYNLFELPEIEYILKLAKEG
jgi:SET domain-containing protein